MKQSKIEDNHSISQRQAVIKLIVKKDRDKRFVKNWRPISLLNVDTKILSKSIAEKLKSALPELISSNQRAYVKNRCISESGRLISDVIEMCDILDISCYLVTMDIEKAFDSLDHDFLLFVLKKFGFGEHFIHWIKVLLNKQQSCIINGGFTIQYFNLEKGADQGDPISAYLFILALEVLFELIKNNDGIRGITIFNHTFLYTTFADDSTFFFNDLLSVKNLVDTFKVFSLFSGLNANFSIGLDSLKGVLEAACGLKSVNLITNTFKILGVHFSYNSTLKVQNNFLDTVKSIQQALRFWNRRIFSLEGKVIIFKTLAISKIVCLAFLTVIPNSLIEELQRIQKTLIWHSSRPKISHKTLCNNFENGGLKHVDISSKIISLQCSWLRKLCDENFHEWKIIPSHLISKYFGKSFKFHSCLSFDRKLLIKFPKFYKNIFFQWSNSFFASSELPSCILSSFLWFNKHILMEKKSIFSRDFSDKGLNIVYQ